MLATVPQKTRRRTKLVPPKTQKRAAARSRIRIVEVNRPSPARLQQFIIDLIEPAAG